MNECLKLCSSRKEMVFCFEKVDQSAEKNGFCFEKVDQSAENEKLQEQATALSKKIKKRILCKDEHKSNMEDFICKQIYFVVERQDKCILKD